MTSAWDEYERAQKNRRSDRMPKRREDVLALRGNGYDVQEIAFGHFRIDGKLDLFLLHRRFHFLPTNERGSYDKAKQIAPEMLRRRGRVRRGSHETPHSDADRESLMKRFQVVNVRRARTPDHWGVQQLAGYTDGKPSYRLIRKFWSKSDAVAYAVMLELGLDAEGCVVEAKP